MREEAGYPLHGTKSRLNYCAAQSPLGGQVAHSQPDGNFPGDHYGYNFRLLYGQGPAAAAGAQAQSGGPPTAQLAHQSLGCWTLGDLVQLI